MQELLKNMATQLWLGMGGFNFDEPTRSAVVFKAIQALSFTGLVDVPYEGDDVILKAVLDTVKELKAKELPDRITKSCELVLELDKRFIPYPDKKDLLKDVNKLVFYAIPEPFTDDLTDYFFNFSQDYMNDSRMANFSDKQRLVDSFYFAFIFDDKDELMGRCFLSKDFSIMVNVFPQTLRVLWDYQTYYFDNGDVHVNDIVRLAYPLRISDDIMFNNVMDILGVGWKQCYKCHSIMQDKYMKKEVASLKFICENCIKGAEA